MGATVAAALGPSWTYPIFAKSLERLIDPPPGKPFPGGEFLGKVMFEDRKRRGNRREVLTGRGLGGRYRLDLSTLTPDTLVIPNDRFYVRTRCPDGIDYSQPWMIRVHGLVEEPIEVCADDVVERTRSMGVHLLECSGSGHGGLISAAEWSGVPVTHLLDRVAPTEDATRVLISGFDDHSRFNPKNDERGCNWTFTREQLEETGAFVATHMNGEPLPQDHGFPVRLIVPGWYGCVCVKWLNEIKYVGDDEPSTPHMRHFAGRTHQHGSPKLARDFIPAEIDLAASPLRVEKWRVDGAIVYRVVGTIWGGKQTTDKLVIRFKEDQSYVPIESCEHTTTRTWSLWSHTWKPAQPGRYVIRLQVDDPAVRTRRLDSGYYGRAVVIDET